MSRQLFLERRAAAKRTAVLAAARTRFSADGFEGANMERIAAEAQVSTATLYRQFPSKLALFEAMLEDGMEVFAQALSAADGLPPRARIGVLARAYAELLDDPTSAGVLRAVFSAAPAAPEVSAAFYEHVKRVVAGAFHGAVDAARRDLLIRQSVDPALPGGHLMGMIEHAILWRRMLANAAGEVPPEQIAESALNAFWIAYGEAKQ